MKVTQPCLTLRPHGFLMEISRPEYWSGLPFLSPGYLPNPGSNPGLPHCRWILYQLSHKGSPRILEWVAYPFSTGSSRPKNQIKASVENIWKLKIHFSLFYDRSMHKIIRVVFKVKVKSLSRVQLFCSPMDCSPPGSSVHGIFQARVLEWVAFSSSRRSSQPRDWIWVSCFGGRRFTVWATGEVQGQEKNSSHWKSVKECGRHCTVALWMQSWTCSINQLFLLCTQ